MHDVTKITFSALIFLAELRQLEQLHCMKPVEIRISGVAFFLLFVCLSDRAFDSSL